MDLEQDPSEMLFTLIWGLCKKYRYKIGWISYSTLNLVRDYNTALRREGDINGSSSKLKTKTWSDIVHCARWQRDAPVLWLTRSKIEKSIVKRANPVPF